MTANFQDKTLAQILEAVAGGSPTPGGGSVSALAGSLASALVEMVVNLTLGKKAFRQHEEELQKIAAQVQTHRQSLAAAMNEDAEAYQEVLKAYRLPQATPEEKARRHQAVQKALKKAADPPLFTAATSLKVMKLCREVIAKGNPNAVSDAAVGALLADAAMRGGIFNVLINLSALDDPHYVETMKKELARLEQESDKVKGEILERVREKIH